MFTDRLTLDGPKRLTGGYMGVRAKAARLGTYDYLGREIDPENKHGLRDAGMVKVLRDEDTVFDQTAARSFIGKPITDNHPAAAVTADNWRQHARGTIMGAMREGDYLAFDLLLTDADAIKKIEAGKRELSNGYSAELEFGDFTDADGNKCVARQTKIFGNHVALVDKGRAGPECRIADAATCEGIPRMLFDELVQRTYSDNASQGKTEPARSDASVSHEGQPLKDGGSQVATKTITFDGMPIEATDAAEAAIRKVEGQRDSAVSAKDAAEAALATAQTETATKDAEIETLKKQIEDAKLTPAQLRDAAKEYATVCDKASALGVKFADDADIETIRKAVVDAKMGEAAKDWSADQIAASFAVLAKDAKPADKLRDAFASPAPRMNDGAAIHANALAARNARFNAVN